MSELVSPINTSGHAYIKLPLDHLWVAGLVLSEMAVVSSDSMAIALGRTAILSLLVVHTSTFEHPPQGKGHGKCHFGYCVRIDPWRIAYFYSALLAGVYPLYVGRRLACSESCGAAIKASSVM